MSNVANVLCNDTTAEDGTSQIKTILKNKHYTT